MPVRCDQCGHESDARYRFCGMCGAKLPPPPPPEPMASKPVREEPMHRVSGPSFLGLAEEPSTSVTYLLEDEMSESHWGRSLVLLIILATLGAAGWHWRSEVRAYVIARLSQQPNNNQPEQETYPGGAVSTAASETALQNPNAITPVENQNTSTNQTTAAATPGQQASVPANNNAAAGEQANTAAAGTQAGQESSPPAQPQTGQGSPTASSPAQQEADGTTAARKSSAGQEASTEEAPKSESTTGKRTKPRMKEADTTGADQLEAEGERYLYGTGVSSNCSRAQRDLQAAAEQGSSKADSVLGTMYATGHCVTRDLPLAYRWFAMALQRDPGNTRLQGDLQVLWNQMSSDERQIAMRRQ